MFGIDLDGLGKSTERTSNDYYTDEGGMLVRPLVDVDDIVRLRGPVSLLESCHSFFF